MIKITSKRIFNFIKLITEYNMRSKESHRIKITNYNIINAPLSQKHIQICYEYQSIKYIFYLSNSGVRSYWNHTDLGELILRLKKI